MNKDWVSNYTDGTLTVVGLLIFVGVFVGAIYFTYRKDRRGFSIKFKHFPLSKVVKNEQ